MPKKIKIPIYNMTHSLFPKGIPPKARKCKIVEEKYVECEIDVEG